MASTSRLSDMESSVKSDRFGKPHIRMPFSADQKAMLRKVSSDGIGYSVVELNDVRHNLAAAVPRSGETLRNRRWTPYARSSGGPGRGHQGLDCASSRVCGQFRRDSHVPADLREFYKSEMPATTYVPQHPCQGKHLAIEALGVGCGKGDVQIERVSEQLVIAGHNGVSWVHCAQVQPEIGAHGVYDRSRSAFNRMKSLFGSVNVRFHEVIRTWLYLGGIVAPEGETQRYKELNRARADFYEDIPFLKGRLPLGQNPPVVFPASTGIGADNRDVTMSGIALVTDRTDILAMPLENPRQVSAFDYASRYSPKSPKFARAMALTCGPYATIFISGTASITDSETRHADDVEAQTHETLDNIAALISEDNLANHGLPGLGATLDNLALVRVYIKRQEDYAKTRAVCEARLGELPTIYAVADVCRDDLLVEIEGIAFSRRD